VAEGTQIQGEGRKLGEIGEENNRIMGLVTNLATTSFQPIFYFEESKTNLSWALPRFL